MPRRLRIEFEGAIDHVMARGNRRQKIVRDDADRRRLIEGLEHAVIRYGWELPSYVVMAGVGDGIGRRACERAFDGARPCREISRALIHPGLKPWN